MARSKLDAKLDEIYAGDPALFTTKRRALGKVLRADGKQDEATRIEKLRRPSNAAALVNRLAFERPKPLKRYLELADKLRKATSGQVDAAKMRALAREDGELLETLVAEARDLGDGTSASTLDRVRETLRAAQVDAELRDRVLAGRVEREERAASVGLDNLAAAPVAAPMRSRAKRSSKAKADTEKAAARTRKQRAQAKAELKDAKAGAKEAAREVARSETALDKAERAHERAAEKVVRAEAKLAKLESTG